MWGKQGLPPAAALAGKQKAEAVGKAEAAPTRNIGLADFPERWAEARPLLEKALIGFADSIEDVEHLIRAGVAVLIESDQAFIVLCNDSGHVIIYAAAAKRPGHSSVSVHLEALEDIAIACGAHKVSFCSADPRFASVVPPGWRAQYTAWSKNLPVG